MTPGDVGSYRQAGLDGLACLPCDPVLPGGTTVHRNSRGPEEPKSWLHWEFWPQRVFYIYIYMLVFFVLINIYICICTVYVYNVCVCIYIYGLYLWPLTLLHVIIHGLIWDSPNAINLLVPFGDDLGMVYEWVYHIIYIT